MSTNLQPAHTFTSTTVALAGLYVALRHPQFNVGEIDFYGLRTGFGKAPFNDDLICVLPNPAPKPIYQTLKGMTSYDMQNVLSTIVLQITRFTFATQRNKIT